MFLLEIYAESSVKQWECINLESIPRPGTGLFSQIFPSLRQPLQPGLRIGWGGPPFTTYPLSPLWTLLRNTWREIQVFSPPQASYCSLQPFVRLSWPADLPAGPAAFFIASRFLTEFRTPKTVPVHTDTQLDTGLLRKPLKMWQFLIWNAIVIIWSSLTAEGR